MSRGDFTHYYSSYLPIDVSAMPRSIAYFKLPLSPGLTVLAQDVRTDRYRFRLRADQPMPVVMNTFWFPGWEAFVDGRPAPIGPETGTGLIRFPLDRGDHNVDVRFGQTRLRRWTSVISLSTAGVAAVLAVLALTRRRPSCSRPAHGRSARSGVATHIPESSPIVLSRRGAKMTQDEP
jgi:hypothetical protein